MRPRCWLPALVACSVAGAEPAAVPPTGCAQASASAAGAAAKERRARLAAYYEHKLALVDGQVYQWQGREPPRRVLGGARHVSVAKSLGYAIDEQDRAVEWPLGSGRVVPVLDDVALLSAGDSGLLAIRCDGSLWERRAGAAEWRRSADAAIHAWVGDSADYYVDPQGRLHARGLAHRGQYGDGRLAEAEGWLAVAGDAVRVAAHTGHAVYLRRDGAVLGTGGNRYGPLGRHGYGDKAVAWGVIFEGAGALATGSRHTLALRPDGSLWIWGDAEGLAPREAMQRVAEVAAGLDETIALDLDGGLWAWAVGERPIERIALPTAR